ncbi:MAG: hypothetical protein ACF8GE_05785 [Phycisphaerales bacterium JB043]
MRRWIAALMIAPIEERESIVESVERTMTELYARSTGSDEDVIGMGDESGSTNQLTG